PEGAVTVASAERPKPTTDQTPLPQEKKPETENAPSASQQETAAENANTGGAALPRLPTAGAARARSQTARSGAVQQYKKDIIERLASRKPKGIHGVRGEVTIEFTIAGTGEVSHARVAQSSGQGTLDEAALAAVTGTRFPTPPPGLTAAQLTYRIPYY